VVVLVDVKTAADSLNASTKCDERF